MESKVITTTNILMGALVAIISASVIGGGVYYFLNQQNKAQEVLIDELQKETPKAEKIKEEVKEETKTEETKDETAGWKIFSNRAGWSVKHPSDWDLSSCRNCKDLTDPEGYVGFFPPIDIVNGHVLIENLSDKPSDKSAKEWINSIKNVSSGVGVLDETEVVVGGMKGYKVIWKGADNSKHETIYVIFDVSKTISIKFAGDLNKYQDSDNYSIYLKMLENITFN